MSFVLSLTAKSTGCSCDCAGGVCTCGGCFAGHYCMVLDSTTLENALVEAQTCASGNDGKRIITEAKVLEVSAEHDILSGVLTDRASRIRAAKQAQYDKLKAELGL